MPFGLKQSDFVDYATRQFQNRIACIQKARGRTLEEIYGAPDLFGEDDQYVAV